MLKGDFQAGMSDDAMQVIPTAWVEAAMARWTKPHSLPSMDSLGLDIARGGKDQTVIARRHGMWFDVPLCYPGTATPDGPTVCGLTIAAARNGAPIHLDVIGVGSSPYDFLLQANQHVLGIEMSGAANGFDKSGRLRFKNMRSMLWWKMREALDPSNNMGVCLPPDRKLKAELCAPMWKPQGNIIYVESREDIVDRINRSPDIATAFILALLDTPRLEGHFSRTHNDGNREYNPYSGRDFDPMTRF